MKKVFIAGATTKLGESVAISLAKQGYSPVIHFFSQFKKAKEIKKSCDFFQESFLVQGDFSSQERVKDFCLNFEHLDCYGIIYLFGPAIEKPLFETSIADWQMLYQTNLFSLIQIIEHLRMNLIKNQGCIITMGTPFLESTKALTKISAYFSVKSSLLSYTRSLAKELLGKVTVNMISPSFLSNTHILSSQKKVSEEEIAFWIVSLFADQARACTGQNIEIDQGYSL